jgi:hypothetical protein
MMSVFIWSFIMLFKFLQEMSYDLAGMTERRNAYLNSVVKLIGTRMSGKPRRMVTLEWTVRKQYFLI